MDFRAPAIGGLDPLAARARAERVRLPVARVEVPPAATVTLAGALPAELATEMATAARRAEELRAQGRELRFEVDPETRRVRCEVRALDGTLIRRIPLREALDVAGGAPLA
jgi:hypothetical protein